MGNSIEKLENALYSVATPIGNLSDITYRAVEVLSNVDVIAAEDTRNTSVLLEKYGIATKLVSYHKFSESQKSDYFVNLLKEGKSIALVSDAGTPLISDPGAILVKEVLNAGFKVIPVVGASAPIALLSSVSRNGEDFKFIGFLPRIKNQIIEIIAKNRDENLIFYESPQRLMETLEIINESFSNVQVAIGRELTKKFEEIKVGNIKEVIEYYKNNILKGEIVAIIFKQEETENKNLDLEIKKLKKLNLKDKEISSILATLYDVNKNDIYKRCLELK